MQEAASPPAPPAAAGAEALPWSVRRVAAAPLPPLAAGAAIAAAVLALLGGVELVLGELAPALRGEAPAWKLDEYRFSAVFALLLGYLPAAHAHAVLGTRRALAALRPVLLREPAALAARLGRSRPLSRGSLRRAGLVGIALALGVPFAVDLSLEAYTLVDLREPNSAALGHRVMLVALGWTLGRFTHTMIAESRWLAGLVREHAEADLFDRAPLAPLARLGLRNALLVAGFFSILALLLADWGARPGLPAVLAGGLGALLALAAAGLLLPLRGARDAVQRTKREELAWCHAAIRRRRAALGRDPDRAEGAPLSELAAYRALVDGVRAWPFDAPTLARFLLYLVIPVGSWLGGAMVERVLDALLD